MFHSSGQTPAHLPLKTTCVEETQLPRGECGFLLPKAKEINAPLRRCPCRSFYPDPIVRSRCGCGHQAWHHEAQPLATVSMDKFLQVVEQMECLRQEVNQFTSLTHDLKQELLRERLAREDLLRTSTAIQARMYENMQYLKISMDDKVEAVVDRTTELSDLIRAHGERLTMVDEFSMDLENRVDRIEQLSGMSRDLTPVASTPIKRKSTPRSSPIPLIPPLMQPNQQLPDRLPICDDSIYSRPWCVRVVFVPCKSLILAYNPDSNGYKRCASRNLQQNLEFPSQGSSCFTSQIETAFNGLFRGRPWMPMTAHRPADEPCGRMKLALLPPHLINRDVWDYPFLNHHCIAHDKMQGDLLYLTLQYEDVTWNEIRLLPTTNIVDESCWDHDEELDGADGAAKYKSPNSEIMYNPQDPPPTYSSRTHSMADKALHKLYMLANSAAMLDHVEHTSTQSSGYTDSSSLKSSLRRMPTPSSSHSTQSPRLSSERNCVRSIEHEATDDDHRDKKPKLRSKHSMPNDNNNGQLQHPIYISGRSKRKIPVREKGAKEPLHFSVTNVTKWRPNLLHPHSAKGKEVARNP